MTARRRAVSARRAEAAGRSICALLLEDPRVAAAEQVAFYAARSGEPPTLALFDALDGRCRRLFPRCAADLRLEFGEVDRWEDLRPGRYGVLEPGAGTPPTLLSQGDVVLVPGLAFDLAGHRLGRGQGWYDRTFVPDATGPWLVGLAYEFQLLESVPHAPHDRRVDAVCSERALHRVTGEGR